MGRPSFLSGGGRLLVLANGLKVVAKLIAYNGNGDNLAKQKKQQDDVIVVSEGLFELQSDPGITSYQGNMDANRGVNKFELGSKEAHHLGDGKGAQGEKVTSNTKSGEEVPDEGPE